MLPRMCAGITPGGCVEEWLGVVLGLGATVIKVEGESDGKEIAPDWYKILSPNGKEFYYFRESEEIDGECGKLEARLKNMENIKEHI
jgi:hypothetical protein